MVNSSHKTEHPILLYENADLIIINKPAGLLSIPDGYDPTLPHIKHILEPDYGEIWIVHRLDKDTSGVMVIARNAESHRKLNESFRLREIEKTYHGLVVPIPIWREMDIQLSLQTNADRKHRTRVNNSNGKEAHSYCRVEKWLKYGILMEIKIFTEISHQIRAHLRAYNLALLGDELYGSGLPLQPFTVPRMMLHARGLGFNHPTTGEWVTFTAPYPADFRAAYTKLKSTKVQDVGI